MKEKERKNEKIAILKVRTPFDEGSTIPRVELCLYDIVYKGKDALIPVNFFENPIEFGLNTTILAVNKIEDARNCEQIVNDLFDKNDWGARVTEKGDAYCTVEFRSGEFAYLSRVLQDPLFRDIHPDMKKYLDLARKEHETKRIWYQ